MVKLRIATAMSYRTDSRVLADRIRKRKARLLKHATGHLQRRSFRLPGLVARLACPLKYILQRWHAD